MQSEVQSEVRCEVRTGSGTCHPVMEHQHVEVVVEVVDEVVDEVEQYEHQRVASFSEHHHSSSLSPSQTLLWCAPTEKKTSS